jgi:NCS1 family nucleobase:cation symporter-1
MMCHYFLVCRGDLHIPDLFTSSQSGIYYYSRGWNYRAYIAYVVGIVPNFYGFLGVFGVPITDGATKMYYFAYPVGLILSFTTYWLLNKANQPICSNMGQMFQEKFDDDTIEAVEAADSTTSRDRDGKDTSCEKASSIDRKRVQMV